MSFCLFGCELRFGAPPTPTPTATPTPTEHLVVVWAADGDLFAWRDDATAPQAIAIGGAIAPYLAPDGGHVAFTRGSQGAPVSLWVVGIDGAGARELVTADTIPVERDARAEIAQVAWLDARTVYFNTRQRYASGTVDDDNLYRVALDGDPQLILPSGAGGHFAPAPDGQALAVIRAGVYDTEKGSISILDPLGARVREAFTFTAVNLPDQPPFYPPLSWNGDSSFVRVPIPDHEGDRVTLWRGSPSGDANIFGYVTAEREGLPVWSDERALYLQAIPAGADLFMANANGENAERIASGMLMAPRWLPDGEHFAYFADGYLWIGKRGDAPSRLLSVSPDQVTFAGGWAVYSTAAGEVRAQSIDGSDSVLITAAANPIFDAAIIRTGKEPQ